MAWFNFCWGAGADFGSYQCGIAQYLFEHYDLVRSDNVLLSGASSGALNATLWLLSCGEATPLQTLVDFSAYYQQHHRFLTSDVVILLRQFLAGRLNELYPQPEEQQRCVKLFNERMFVQVTQHGRQKGRLVHAECTTIDDIAHLMAQTSYIPILTGPCWQSAQNHPEYIAGQDGGFSDNTPRLLVDTDGVSVCWASHLATKPFQPVTRADPLHPDASRVLPHMVINATRWRKWTKLRLWSGLYVRLSRNHILDMAQLGYQDAAANRADFDAIPHLLRRPFPVVCQLTST